MNEWSSFPTLRYAFMACICEMLLAVNLKGTDRMLGSQGKDNGYLRSR